MTSSLLIEYLKNPKLSRFREQLIEHIFIADIVQAGLSLNKIIIVSKSEIDAWGYDVVLSCEGITRHIQLKSQTKPKSIVINSALSKMPGACVIKVVPIVNDRRIRLNYFFYGDHHGKTLRIDGFKKANFTRYAKAKSGLAVRKARDNHVKIPTSNFTKFPSAEELVKQLFL